MQLRLCCATCVLKQSDVPTDTSRNSQTAQLVVVNARDGEWRGKSTFSRHELEAQRERGSASEGGDRMWARRVIRVSSNSAAASAMRSLSVLSIATSVVIREGGGDPLLVFPYPKWEQTHTHIMLPQFVSRPIFGLARFITTKG